MKDTDSHKYLGRLLCTSASDRVKIEVRNRRRAAWASLHKHKYIILDDHVSLELRLKYFDVCVGPTILFGMVVFPMTSGKIEIWINYKRRCYDVSLGSAVSMEKIGRTQ